MRVISCSGYYGTGSSAVTDYVSEFSSVKSLGSYEFRFLHDMDGVADLEYHLVENHNRHNSGHAIKRYRRLVDFYAGSRLVSRYEPFFGNQWRSLSYSYLDELTDFSYPGWWQYDLLDRGTGFYYRKLLLNKLYRLTLGRGGERTLNVLPKEITYCGRPTEEAFTAATRRYLQGLLSAANPEDQPNIMVDQLLPPSGLPRFLKFFDDVKVVIVDRDPRDLYISEKFIWKGNILPTCDPETFCRHYCYCRQHRREEQLPAGQVLLVRFEDMIYHYEETTRKLREFLGLEEADHSAPGTIFVPEKSRANTRLYERYDIGEDLAVITRELGEYLYDFPEDAEAAR